MKKQQHRKRYYFHILTFLLSAAFNSSPFTIIVGTRSFACAAELNKFQQEEDKNVDYDGADLIEWITSNGGFIHPNARIGLDPTGNYRGVFVKSVGGEEGGTEEGIQDDELVCSIPW